MSSSSWKQRTENWWTANKDTEKTERSDGMNIDITASDVMQQTCGIRYVDLQQPI